MPDKVKLYKALKRIACAIGIIYLVYALCRFAGLLIYRNIITTREQFNEILQSFFTCTSVGLLALVASCLFKALCAGEGLPSKITRRLVHTCCASFCLLGVVNIAVKIYKYFIFPYALLPDEPGALLMIPGILLLDSFPIFCGIIIVIMYNIITAYIQFESEVA